MPPNSFLADFSRPPSRWGWGAGRTNRELEGPVSGFQELLRSSWPECPRRDCYARPEQVSTGGRLNELAVKICRQANDFYVRPFVPTLSRIVLHSDRLACPIGSN